MDELPRFDVYDDEDIVAAEPEVADLDEVPEFRASLLLSFTVKGICKRRRNRVRGG